jgi:hypothetical protein
VLQRVGDSTSGNDIDILGTNTDGPAGILAPGEQGSVTEVAGKIRTGA